MKKIVYIFISLSFTSCFSQQDSITPLGKHELSNIEKRKEIVKKYVNELNSYEYNAFKVLPHFFYEYDFDINNKQGWINRQSPISLRKLIIEQIDNIVLLKQILNSENKFLRIKKDIPKTLSNYEILIPYQEYSTYDLVKIRVEEILNKYNMGESAPNYSYKVKTNIK